MPHIKKYCSGNVVSAHLHNVLEGSYKSKYSLKTMAIFLPSSLQNIFLFHLIAILKLKVDTASLNSCKGPVKLTE